MPEKRREKVSRYDMISGEDTYASQTAQNPATSRRIQSWIPEDDGAMYRELPEPTFGGTIQANGNGPIVALYEFDQNDINGNVVRFFFAVAQLFSGTSPGYTLFQLVNGAWVGVSAIPGFFAIPSFATINNLLHVVDGTNEWIFDGLNWLKEGFTIPSWAGPAIDSTQAGTLSANVGRYYWTSYADHTVNRVHESTASPISKSSGALASKKVVVYQQAGLWSLPNSSPNVTVSASADNPGPTLPTLSQAQVGMDLYINGTLVGTIAEIPSNTSVVLNINWGGAAITNGRAVIVPARATHWHIYASESDGSQVGQFLASIPVTTSSYTDQSPFFGQPNTLFSSVFRPVRNDPSLASSLQAVHKYRLFRRWDAKPNQFFFCANEEVTNNGNPAECFPGVDPNTQSDIINEEPYPDDSNRLRAMVSHADALYLFTEKNAVPMWGESIDDFALSQVNAFNVGAAGRFAAKSTSHGLAFVSYDRKAFLYPSANYPWAYIPKDVNITEQLIEIGKPMRKKFEQINFANLDQVRTIHYKFGRRDWFVVSWLDNSGNYSTYVYDFSTKGWFQLQRGFASLAVFEVQNGISILVGGGGTDNNVYVIDDLTGTYTSTAALPQSIWRTALIDFGDPDSRHIPRYVEFELTNAAMSADITINYYLDPVDVDNPGTPRTVVFSQVRGSNLYRGFFKGGNVCQRMLLEFNAASSTNAGALRGVKLVADPATGLIF